MIEEIHAFQAVGAHRDICRARDGRVPRDSPTRCADKTRQQPRDECSNYGMRVYTCHFPAVVHVPGDSDAAAALLTSANNKYLIEIGNSPISDVDGWTLADGGRSLHDFYCYRPPSPWGAVLPCGACLASATDEL